MADDSNKKKKHFFKDMKTELKKVTWLTPKQLVNNTTAVIVMVLIVAVIVFILDFTFENINNYGVEGLKSVIQNDETNTTENVTDDIEIEGTTDDTTSDTTDDSISENEENDDVSNEAQE